MLSEAKQKPHFRGDQPGGITPPNLAVDSTPAEHIVRARGKRSRLTSMSEDRNKAKKFGPALYKLDRQKLERERHELIVHSRLIVALRDSAKNGSKASRTLALRALRYARGNAESLVDWKIDPEGIETKDLYQWTRAKVNQYFSRKR